jgi:hypothetical protein
MVFATKIPHKMLFSAELPSFTMDLFQMKEGNYDE